MHLPFLARSKRPRGQATVEFAFVFPIFLGAFLGLVFFAMLFYSYVTLQLAVREGASELVHHPNDTTYTIRNTVCQAGFSLAQAQMSVYVEPPDTFPTCSSSCSCSSLNTGEGVYSGWQSGVSFAITGFYTVPLPSIKIPTTSGSIIILGPIQISAKSIMTFD